MEKCSPGSSVFALVGESVLGDFGGTCGDVEEVSLWKVVLTARCYSKDLDQRRANGPWS